MRRHLPLMLTLALALVGCQDPATDTSEGIAVGNPGVLAMTLADSDDFTVAEAALPVDWVGYAACDGSDRLSPLSGTWDFASGPFVVEALAGEWCGVVVRFTGAATFQADWDDGIASGSVGGALSVGELGFQPVDGPLVIDEGTRLVLELGSPDWLDAAGLGLEDGEVLDVDSESPEHAILVALLAGESAVFDDADGSGALDETERNAGALALPAEIQFNEDVAYGIYSDSEASSGGCSCASGGGVTGSGAAWLLVLMAAGLLHRRRSAAPRALLLS